MKFLRKKKYCFLALSLTQLILLLALGVFGCVSGCVRTAKTAGGFGSDQSRLEDNETIVYSLQDTILRSHPPRHPEAIEAGGLGDQPENTDEIPLKSLFLHPVHDGEINALAVSLDGLSAYSGGTDGRVMISTIIGRGSAPGNKRYVQTERLAKLPKPVLGLSLSPDERLLAVTSTSRVLIFDLVSRRIVHRLTRIKGRITAVAWDPRGEMVVIGRSDGDVFAWNLKRGEAAGQDSLDAVEEYFGASSAIVGVAFHPSGRVFFTAEIGGRLTLWRLLRTEQELGMRDKAAVIDEKQRGVHRQTFADLPVKVRDFWLDSDGVFLYAAAEDGKVYRFKVRGLKSIGELTVGKDILYSVTGLSLGSSKLLANSGRTQRLEFWCQSRDLQEDAVRSRGSLLTGMALAPDAVDDFVAQSEKLKYPPDLIRSSATGALLWATQKTGNLLTFDANFLLATPNLRNRAENCR